MDETDFEFDFFSEKETTGDEWHETLGDEHAADPEEHALPARTRPPSSQTVMRRRVAAAAVIALLLLIILIVVVTGGSSGPSSAYRSYLTALSPIAADSARVGGSLSQAVGSQGASAKSGLVARLDNLVQQTVSDVSRVQALTPPAALRSEHEQAVAALDLRLHGLQGIRDSLAQAVGAADTSPWAAVLSAQVDDLVTSDVIWDSFVRGPAYALLQADGVGGVTVPESRFVAGSNLSLLRPMLTLIQAGGVSAQGPVLKLGDTGTAVTSWQTQLNAWIKLKAPTLTPLTPDGNFGASTQTATEALQTAQGLAPDGIVGPSTRHALQVALTGAKQSSSPGASTAAAPVLKLGDTGTAVTSWQTQLNAWLKLTAPTQTPLTTDGNFGAATQTATEALQTAQGLAPDGVVGPSTRQALQAALAKSQSKTRG